MQDQNLAADERGSRGSERNRSLSGMNVSSGLFLKFVKQGDSVHPVAFFNGLQKHGTSLFLICVIRVNLRLIFSQLVASGLRVQSS